MNNLPARMWLLDCDPNCPGGMVFDHPHTCEGCGAEAGEYVRLPKGWKIVPEEPTEEMNRAAIWALDRWREKFGNPQERVPAGQKYAIRYRAMLAAAPASMPQDDGGGQ